MRRFPYSVAVVFSLIVLTGCSTDEPKATQAPVGDAGVPTEDSIVESVTTGDSTAFKECPAFDTTFTKTNALVTANCDETYLYITSETGLPPTQDPTAEEQIMVGITSWIQRVAIPFTYNWKVPLRPNWLDASIEASPKGPIAVAIDGVPIFHYERRPDVSTALSNYTERNDTVLAGELDQCGGHAGQGDDYHYHYAPICLLDEHDLTQPIAFGLDGAPVFFGQAGTDYYGNGRFNDWDNFPVGITPDDLDECNALKQDDGSYIHFSTKTAPYLIGCHHAEFDTALQIEPRPMRGREQGLETPLGGQYGEPVQTVMREFSSDGNGQYTLKFDAVDGSSNPTNSIIYSQASTSATETCWSFEYRTNENQAGETYTACRDNLDISAFNNQVSFEHNHVH